MAYVKTGPFVSGSAPGISATFLNNVENFLVTVNSAATDAAITSAGSGNLSTTGSITSTKATGTGLSITAASSLTGILTLGNGVNVGIIRDNVAGHSVLDLTAGDGSLKLVGASLLAHVLGNFSVDGTTSLDAGNITTDGSGTLQIAKAGTAFAGSVAGSCTFFAPIWGSGLKMFLVTFGGFNTSAGHAFSLPTSLSRNAFLMAAPYGGSGFGCKFTLSGSDVGSSIITALASTTGTAVSQTLIPGWSIGGVISTVDSFVVQSTNGNVINGAFICIGV